VIDGEGSQDTKRVVESYRAVLVRYRATPPGSSLQRNEGLSLATGDVVVFIDDDISFDLTPDVFGRLAQLFQDETVVGITGQIDQTEARAFGRSSSRVRRFLLGGDSEGRFTDFGYPRYLQNPQTTTDVEYMYGCFMAVRIDLARAIGFDEELMGYALCEDEDFSYRLSRRGRIQLAPSIVIRHEPFGKRNARLKDRMLVANRTYLFRKNFQQTPAARLKFAAFIAMLVGHRLINGELDGARGLLEGIADALRGRVPFAAAEASRAVPYADRKDGPGSTSQGPQSPPGAP